MKARVLCCCHTIVDKGCYNNNSRDLETYNYTSVCAYVHVHACVFVWVCLHVLQTENLPLFLANQVWKCRSQLKLFSASRTPHSLTSLSLSDVPLSRSSISFTTSSARCSLSQCPHLSRRKRALVVVPPLPQLLPLPLPLPLPPLQLPLPLLLRLLPVALCLCKISAIAFLGLFVLSPLSSSPSPSAALFWQLVHPFGAELCN